MGVKFLAQGNNNSRKPQSGIKPATLQFRDSHSAIGHFVATPPVIDLVREESEFSMD